MSSVIRVRKTIDNNGLYDGNGERFVVKGIAFPDPVPLLDDLDNNDDNNNSNAKKVVNYNATAWIDVLKQLREEIPAETGALNAIRVYPMEPTAVDYSEFFNAAADLGFYVMVPLTSGWIPEGILNRGVAAPLCYPIALYDYGRVALNYYLQFPNILAGVIGNEVMNSLESWHAAPCLASYARDLQHYQRVILPQQLQLAAAKNDTLLQEKYRRRMDPSTKKLLPIPIMYAAQDSGIGAVLSNVDVLRLTLDYLSTTPSPPGGSGGGGIDIFGVNVESWCSSFDTFQQINNGTAPGTFWKLWRGLHFNVHRTALIMSELGCSHNRYNRDETDPSIRKEVRDWYEVPALLNDMADTWSGYCAYAYWGNTYFNMMQNGPWNGRDVLEPGTDFDNFVQVSLQYAVAINKNRNKNSTNGSTNANVALPLQQHESNDKTSLYEEELPMLNGGIMKIYYDLLAAIAPALPTNSQVGAVLNQASSGVIQLYDIHQMPMYSCWPHPETCRPPTPPPTMTTEQQSLPSNVYDDDGGIPISGAKDVSTIMPLNLSGLDDDYQSNTEVDDSSLYHQHHLMKSVAKTVMVTGGVVAVVALMLLLLLLVRFCRNMDTTTKQQQQQQKRRPQKHEYTAIP